MIHFTSLEMAGLSMAVMSDKTDGDCSSRPEAEETRKGFLDRIQVRPESLVRLRQVHGIKVVEASGALAGRKAAPVEADGMFTAETGVALSIAVADCTPVILFDPGRRVAAVLHAGREGTFRNIAAAGVRAVCRHSGCAPDVLRAAIGPCAGACCYEVSPECAHAWRTAGLPLQGRHLKLREANRLQLENAGLIRHNIAVMPHCTICGGLFFSYRAGEISSRNLVVVML